MDIVSKARDLAHRAHAGQVDKAGRPYIEHVARVAAAVSDDPHDEAVAWMHDVLEDCSEEFRAHVRTFPWHIVMGVVDITCAPEEPASQYYSRVKANPWSLRVKLADIADNSSEERLSLLDKKTAARLRRKYADAIKALTSEEAPDVSG